MSTQIETPNQDVQRRRRRRALVATWALVVAGGTGVAYSYWTSDGTGTGTAATKTSQLAITVTQTSVVADLRPGGPAVTLEGTIDNPASNGDVHVDDLLVSIDSVVDGLSAPIVGCDATDYTLSAASVTLNIDVAEGTSESWTGPTISFNNKAGVNQDACKDATVNLAYSTSTS